MASAVAAAIDSSLRSEMLGSVAGDDAVLIITESPEKAQELERKIKNTFKTE
jgi:arginine repressor